MNRPLVPEFLKKLDNDLLKNSPVTWSSRVHLLIYYSVLFCIAVGLFAFATFNDPRVSMQSEVPMMFTFMITFIGLVVWLIFLLRFNVFKRFGEDITGNGIKTFLLFFTGFFFLVLPNYIPMIVESWKANMKYTSAELVKDANRINELITAQNKALVPTIWDTDTLLLVPEKDKRLVKNQHNNNTDDVVVTIDTAVLSTEFMQVPSIDYYIVDKYDLQYRLKEADSSFKINDSMYVIAKCPNLQFIYAGKAADHVDIKLRTSKQLYDSIVKGNVIINSAKNEPELKALLEKYNSHESSYYVYGPDNYDSEDLSFNGQIQRKYQISSANSGIYNISSKKYTWDKENFPVYFRVIFYCSFILSILLFIFRHSTVRTFFLSVLTVIVLMIFTGLILTVTRYAETGILGLMLFYYLIMLVILFVSQNFKTRTFQGGVSLNLVTAFCAFVPLLCVYYYYEYLQFRNGYGYYDEELFVNKNSHMLIAEITGIVLFLIILEPVFKKLYRKWYALPEN